MTPFQTEGAPPRGAEAQMTGDTLEVSWPASTVTLRLGAAVVLGVLGLALSVKVSELVPALPLQAGAFLGLFGGGALGAVLSGFWLAGARVVLRVSRSAVELETRGVPLRARRSVPRSDVRDVLIIEEQDGETKSGRPIMVHRLVAPLVSGGRRVLVDELASPAYGQFAEDCFARWTRAGR